MQEDSTICLNGYFLPSSKASIPVTDRGFRFGDGVFETIRVIQGIPYQWNAHLDRLNGGLEALRITPPPIRWQHYVQAILSKNEAKEGFLRLTVSRGAGGTGYLPASIPKPTWVIEYMASLEEPPSVATLWVSSITRPSLSSLPTMHKLSQGLGNTLALMEARDHGYDNALMLSHEGNISEAANANIFWIKDNCLFTPSLGMGCLAGTTRATVLRLSPFATKESAADLSSFMQADSIFLTNVRLGIQPVLTVSGRKTAYDTEHPIIQTLKATITNDRIAYRATHYIEWMQV